MAKKPSWAKLLESDVAAYQQDQVTRNDPRNREAEGWAFIKALVDDGVSLSDEDQVTILNDFIQTGSTTFSKAPADFSNVESNVTSDQPMAEPVIPSPAPVPQSTSSSVPQRTDNLETPPLRSFVTATEERNMSERGMPGPSDEVLRQRQADYVAKVNAGEGGYVKEGLLNKLSAWWDRDVGSAAISAADALSPFDRLHRATQMGPAGAWAGVAAGITVGEDESPGQEQALGVLESRFQSSEAKEKAAQVVLDRVAGKFDNEAWRQLIETTGDGSGSGSSILSVFGGPTAALTFGDVFLQEYGQARRAGLDPDQAFDAAVGQSASEAALSIVPTAGLVRKIPGVSSGIESIEKQVSGVLDTTLGKAAKVALDTGMVAAGEGGQEAATFMLQDQVRRYQGLVGEEKARKYALDQVTSAEEYVGELWRNARAGAFMAGSIQGPRSVVSAIEGGQAITEARMGLEGEIVGRAERVQKAIDLANQRSAPAQEQDLTTEDAPTPTQETITPEQKAAEEDAAWEQRRFERSREDLQEGERRLLETRLDEAREDVEVLQEAVEDGARDSQTLNDLAAANRNLRTAEERLAAFDESSKSSTGQEAMSPVPEPTPEPVVPRDPAEVEAERLETVARLDRIEAIRKTQEEAKKKAEATAKKEQQKAERERKAREKRIREEIVAENPDVPAHELEALYQERLDEPDAAPLSDAEVALRKRINSARGRLARKAKPSEQAEGKRIEMWLRRNPGATVEQAADALRTEAKTAPAPVVPQPKPATTTPAPTAPQAKPAAPKKEARTQPKPAPKATAPGKPVENAPPVTKNDKDLSDAEVDELRGYFTNMVEVAAEDAESLGMADTAAALRAAGQAGQGTAPQRIPDIDLEAFKAKTSKLVRALVNRTTRDSRSVQDMIWQGKLHVVPSAESIGRNSDNAAEYDAGTGAMYLFADKLDNPSDVVGIIAKAFHEATHAGQFNDREGRSNLFKHFLGDPKVQNSAATIRKAAASGNRIGQRAVNKAELDTFSRAVAKGHAPSVEALRKHNGDRQKAKDEVYSQIPESFKGVENLEVVGYFTSEVVESRGSALGTVGGVARDITSTAREFLRDKLGMDLDITLGDLNTAAANVGTEIAQTNVRGLNSPQVLGMIYNVTPNNISPAQQEALDNGWVYESIDGTQKFILSDHEATLKPQAGADLRSASGATRLADIIDHPILFSEREGAADLPVYAVQKVLGTADGMYDPGVPAIYVKNSVLKDPDKLKGVLLHEAQHYVQDMDGRSGQFYDGRDLVARKAELQNELAEQVRTLDTAARELLDTLPNTIPARERGTLMRKLMRNTTEKDSVNAAVARDFVQGLETVPQEAADAIAAYEQVRQDYNAYLPKYNAARSAAHNDYLANITEGEAHFVQDNAAFDTTGVNPEPEMRDRVARQINVPGQRAPVLGMASDSVDRSFESRRNNQIEQELAAILEEAHTQEMKRAANSALDKITSSVDALPSIKATAEKIDALEKAGFYVVGPDAITQEQFVSRADRLNANYVQMLENMDREHPTEIARANELSRIASNIQLLTEELQDIGRRYLVGAAQARGELNTRTKAGKEQARRYDEAIPNEVVPILGMAAVDAGAADFSPANSPELANWLGRSKIVNKNGTPSTYYHGTKHYIDAFMPNDLGLIFASPKKEFAESFAGLDPISLEHKEPIPLFVRAENPWDYDNADHVNSLLEMPVRGEYGGGLVRDYVARYYSLNLTPEEAVTKLKEGDWSIIETPPVVEALKILGHDALHVYEGGAKNIAVFEPNQLKHATDNKGAWSRQDDSIFGMAAESDSPAKEERARVTRVSVTGAFRNDKGLGEDVLNLVEIAKSSPAYDTMAAESLVRNYQDALDAMAKERGTTARDLGREIFDKLEKAAAETDSYADNKAAWADVLSEYGRAGEVLMDMRNKTDALSIEALRLRREQGGDFSPEDLRAHKAIAANLGRYVHRMYAAGSGKAGPKYGKAMWDAYMKKQASSNPDNELSLLERQNAAVVERAMKVLADDLRIPDDASLVEMDRQDLEKLYHTWINTAAVGLDMDTMVDRLIDARDKLNGDTNELNNHVERAAKDLLNLLKNNATTPIGVFYRGNKIDRGILKEKKSIAPAIRELMGEIRDPGIALLGSIAKTSEFVTRSKLMLDLRKLEGRDLQPPNAGGSDLVAQGNLQPLKGADYGALEGWYASPNMEAMLKETVEHVASLEQALTSMGSNPEMINKKLLMKVADNWMKIAGYTKAASILGNPVNFGINFAGSFDTMLQNGNFTSPETQLRALNDAWHLVKYAADPSQSTEAIRLLAKYDVIDSARIGELKNMNYKQLQTYIRSLTKEGGRKRGKIMAFGRGYKETYAMADVWAKIANFHQNVNDLTAYNNAEGLGWTQDEIYSRASAATKRTNFTYSRTAPFIKSLERGGITMFGTYFYETYRTQVENIVEVGRDFKMGKDAKTAEGQRIGYTRAAKRLTGIIASNSFKYYAAQALAKLMFGDDEEKWYNIRGLLADFVDNQDFIPVGRDKNGGFVMFPISRVDAYGPGTDILREIMHGNGDPSAVVEQLLDLYIAPRVGGAIIQEIRNKGRKPTTQMVAEDTYGGAVNALAHIPGMDGGSAARVVKLFANLGETALPGFVNSWRENNVRPVGTDLSSQMAAYSTYMGVRLYNLDPNVRVRSAGFDYKNFESDTRTQIKDYFKSQVSPSVDVVEDMVLGIAADEKKEWDKLRRIYLGMQDIGMPDDEIEKVMTESPLPAGVRNSVMSGSFVPTAVSVQSVRAHRDNLLKGKDEEEKAKIKERWDNMVEILEGVLSE